MTDADRFHIPPQGFYSPSPVATNIVDVDLTSLIAWWRDTEQRLRDQLAVERTAASSAREALAAAEERARVLSQQFELSKMALEHAKQHAATGPEPGSVPAVIEAYRLLVGHEPHFGSYDGSEAQWMDGPSEVVPVDIALGRLRRAASQMLCWLDKHAPGGKP